MYLSNYVWRILSFQTPNKTLYLVAMKFVMGAACSSMIKVISDGLLEREIYISALGPYVIMSLEF